MAGLAQRRQRRPSAAKRALAGCGGTVEGREVGSRRGTLGKRQQRGFDHERDVRIRIATVIAAVDEGVETLPPCRKRHLLQ